ncbi:putative immunity protein [Hymenobacter koreensis]|uniref:Imm-5-like domain-containing protein n=1 Tax=Hymenobacter koreensis TaxID=1084523 RepID=A0ABP8IVI3_9BACT
MSSSARKHFANLASEVHHVLALWAAACAEHTLHLFEDQYPEDPRPRLALVALRAWVRGEQTMTQCRTAAFAAHAAARVATNPAAVAAARAAGQAAATAHTYAHAPHAAAYAAKAAAQAVAPVQGAATRENERAWQRRQLPGDLHAIGFPRKTSPSAEAR